jgi:hypothetical protein
MFRLNLGRGAHLAIVGSAQELCRKPAALKSSLPMAQGRGLANKSCVSVATPPRKIISKRPNTAASEGSSVLSIIIFS